MVPRKEQMNEKDKIVTLTHLEDGWLVKDVAAKFNVDRTTIFRLKKKAENMEPGQYAPKRKT